MGDRAPGRRALPRVPDRGRPRARAQPRVEHAAGATRKRSPTSSPSAARGRSWPRPVFAAWLGVPLITLIRGNDFDAAVFSTRRRPILDDALRALRARVRRLAGQGGQDRRAAPGARGALDPERDRPRRLGARAERPRAGARLARRRRRPARARPLRPAEGQEGRRLPARRAAALRRRRPLPPAARGLDGAGHGGVAGRARASSRTRRSRSWTASSCCRGTRRATGSRSRPSTTGCRTCSWRRRRSACRWSPRASTGWPTCSTDGEHRVPVRPRRRGRAARGRCSARRGWTRQRGARWARRAARSPRTSSTASARSTRYVEALAQTRRRGSRAPRDPLLRARRRARPPHPRAQGARRRSSERRAMLLTASRHARDPRVTGGRPVIPVPRSPRPRPRRVSRLARRARSPTCDPTS